MPGGGPRRVAILTAIQVEYQAVRAHLTDLREEVHLRGTVYERGSFSSDEQLWDVVIGEIGPRNPRAALETERAINQFKPIIIFFVGIAGGIKDVTYGDVVVATQACAYTSGKAKKTLEPRPIVGNSAYNLVQRAKAVARKADWLQRIKGQVSISMPPPRVFVGPIASGDRVVASTHSSDWKILRSKYGDALAVDMEGYGFLDAAHDNKVDALVIRGISDLVDDKNDDFHNIAAQHASALAFEILAKVVTADLQQNEGVTPTSIVDENQEIVEISIPTVEVQGELGTSTSVVESEGVVSATPTVADNQPASEGNAPSIEMPDAPETSILETEAQLLQDSLISVRQYIAKIRDMCDFFGDRRTPFPDQYKRAITLMDGLEEVVKEMNKNILLSRNISLTIRTVKVSTDNLLDQISGLRSELRNFPRLHSSSKQAHHYVTTQEKIRSQFDLLLASLEQLVNER